MISIESIASYIPKSYFNNKQFKKIFGKNFYKIINYTGFSRVHRIKKGSSPDQFIFRSLKKYFEETQIKINEIDTLIYSSHTRVNEMPIFSANIQNRFNLKNNILCYDLPGSCAGFTNGLLHAYSFIKSGVSKKVLLICADVHSNNLTSKNLVPVISDGVSCILIKKEQNFFFYDFGVDGKQNNSLSKSSYKNPLEMDGIKVLEFALKRVPETVKNVLKKSKKKIDFYSLHQPNKSMYDLLINKLKLKNEKVIKCSNFGNTSSPSIPISLSGQFGKKTIKNKTFLFCGFGAGLSWSSIIMKLKKTKIYKTKLIN